MDENETLEQCKADEKSDNGQKTGGTEREKTQQNFFADNFCDGKIASDESEPLAEKSGGGAGAGGENAKPKKSDTKSRIITGTVMFACYVLLFLSRALVSPYFFDAALLFIFLVGSLELVRAFKKFTPLVLVYPFLPVLAIAYLNHLEGGFSWLLLLFLAASLTDVFAYVFGCTLGRGRRKLAPRLSPNKTYIGALGGLAGGVAGAMIVYALTDVLKLAPKSYILFNTDLKILLYFFAGLLIAVFTEAGDLFASFLKRRTGIKDYGKVFPGHGGVLDRFDGLIAAALALCVLAMIF